MALRIIVFLKFLDPLHNSLYIRNDLIFQANYMAGFRILDGSSLSSSDSYDGLTELGYFDIYPQSDDNQFNGE